MLLLLFLFSGKKVFYITLLKEFKIITTWLNVFIWDNFILQYAL